MTRRLMTFIALLLLVLPASLEAQWKNSTTGLTAGSVDSSHMNTSYPSDNDIYKYDSGSGAWQYEPEVGAGLTYFTEADDGDTSALSATAPNVELRLDDRLKLIMTNADTLDTGDQSSVDSLAHKPARITLLTTNQYGSNAAGGTRKNWGGWHLYDGPGGTSYSCGLSAYFRGDHSFCLHLITEGDHSSAIKIAMLGDNPNHRGMNILMPLLGTETSQTGVLVRDQGSVGRGVSVEKRGDGYGVYVHADSASAPLNSSVPLYVVSEHDTTVAIFKSNEKDATTAAKVIVSVVADTVYDSGNIRGIDIGGTDFNSVTDTHLRLLTADGEYWGWGINPTTHALAFASSEDTPGIKAYLDTLGRLRDVDGDLDLTAGVPDAFGEARYDTAAGEFEVHDGSGVRILAGIDTKTFQFTINDPENIPEDPVIVWSNETGHTVTILGINAWSDVDDYIFELEEYTKAGAAAGGRIDSVAVTDNGTGRYYTATEITSFDHATIEDGNTVSFDQLGTAADMVKVSVRYRIDN